MRISSRYAELAASVAAVLILSLACAAPEATATPVPPATPAPAVAPPTGPTPTPAISSITPQTPTPALALPTPTRALPTPTAAVTAKPSMGGTLRFATRPGVDTLDPHHTVQPYSYQPMFSIYDGLVKIDVEARIEPELAESWETSSDGKAVTFHLRKGVKFQDGTPFNAQTVKWNFDRMADPNEFSPRKGEVAPIRLVQVVDENTVTLHLYEPYRPLLAQLASERTRFLVSPAAVAKYGGGKGGNFGRSPVGTGAFRLDKWTPGESVLLKRNDSYWEKGKPYLDAIVIQKVSEPPVRLAMLRTGETDIIYGLDVRVEDVPIIQSDPKLRVVVRGGSNTPLMHFNPVKPPFDNKALRQAIAYSIDREKFIKAIMPGGGVVGLTPIAAGWARNPDLKLMNFDLAKAKQKLAEAGYPGGATIPIGCPSAGRYLQWCEVFQALMKEAGIKAEPLIVYEADYFNALDKGFLEKAGLGMAAWASRIDPHITVHRGWHSQGFYMGGNRYKNTELDRLIDEAATLYDTAKAKVLYDKIQTFVAEEALMVFIAWQDTYSAQTKAVQGFTPYPDTWERLQELWLQK